VVDESDPELESDLRRRAAWLLVMLAIVAVLLIVVISALVNTNTSSGHGHSGAGPLDPAALSPGGTPTSAHHTAASAHHTAASAHDTKHQHHPSGAPPTTRPGPGHTSCPTAQTCVVQGDVGNAIQAINDYRTQHRLPAVPGSVSTAAQACAVHNGNGCSGGWAETELADPDGREAVQKILPFAHLDDPNMTSVQVGWAYDPGAQLYYFAIVRND
jgi:hypothetical protein